MSMCTSGMAKPQWLVQAFFQNLGHFPSEVTKIFCWGTNNSIFTIPHWLYDHRIIQLSGQFITFQSLKQFRPVGGPFLRQFRYWDGIAYKWTEKYSICKRKTSRPGKTHKPTNRVWVNYFILPAISFVKGLWKKNISNLDCVNFGVFFWSEDKLGLSCPKLMLILGG